MIRLVRVQKADEPTLERLMQKYLYEMTRVYDADMDEEGNYAYPYLPCYFTEPSRMAYFLYNEEGRRVGFALVNTHCFVPEPADHGLAELTIFPKYRKRGYALEAMRTLTTSHPGRWQLKFSPRNTEGAALWERFAKIAEARKVELPEGEIALLWDAGFSNRTHP